jgi:hypothetical protein
MSAVAPKVDLKYNFILVKNIPLASSMKKD